MKRHMLLAMVVVSCLSLAEAQRRPTGNTRDPQIGNSNSNSGESSSRLPEGRSSEITRSPVSLTPQPDPPPAPIHHDPIVCPQPEPPSVCIGCPPSNPVRGGVRPRPDVIVIVEHPDIEEEEIPEPATALLFDRALTPARSGYDFSSEEVVNAADKRSDIYFVVNEHGSEFVVGEDADIEDLGTSFSFLRMQSIPLKDWSPTHRVRAEVDNLYIIWTWDNQYYKFSISSLGEDRAAIEWMKMDQSARIAANIDIRDGKSHRKEADMFSR